MTDGRRQRWRRSVLGVGVLLMLFGTQPRLQQQMTSAMLALPEPWPVVRDLCATGRETAVMRGLVQRVALEDNAPLGYQVFPTIIEPNCTEDFRIVFEFVGDVPTLTFRQFDDSDEGFTPVTLERTGTRSVDGRLISIFDRTFPASVLATAVWFFHGYDWPRVPIGELELPWTANTDRIRVRLAQSNLPVSEVRPLNVGSAGATANTALTAVAGQYASHVVNLHIPSFGDERVQAGDQDYDDVSVLQEFYKYIKDEYEVVAIIPEKAPMSTWGGFHQVVKSDVTGLNLNLYDNSGQYGSNAALRGVEVYALGSAFVPATFLHEQGHQHGSYYELATLIGAEGGGHDPDGHMALSDQGETLVGAVLEGTRKVMKTSEIAAVESLAASEFQVVRTDAPLMYHPLQRYRMGLLDGGQVPDIEVFDNQKQFDPDSSSDPKPGTMLVGNTQTVTMNQIRAEYGDRSGPVLTHVRVAFVVVTRDGLLPQQAMDWFNFYAQRMGVDSGTRSYDGYPSFNEATGGVASLTTDINPLTAEKINQGLPVSNAAFGPTDWRGLVLDGTFPGQITTDQRLTVSGSVDQNIHGGKSFVAIIVRFTKYGQSGGGLTTQGSVSSNGSFSFDANVPQDPGAYSVDMFLFETFESSATSTAVLEPIFVTAP